METQTRRRKPKRNYKPSPAKDNCQTPPYALLPIQQYLAPHWVVWEPAAGEGYLADAMRPFVWSVLTTDVLTGHDFLAQNPLVNVGHIHAIVTNPPGSTKYKWFKQCCWLWYTYHIPFALLMPGDVMLCKTGADLIQEYGVETIIVTPRINYKMPFKGWRGQSQFASAWFTKGLGVGERTTWFDIPRHLCVPPQEPEGELLKQEFLFDPTAYEVVAPIAESATLVDDAVNSRQGEANG
jgi:hypothetical protein